MKRKCDVRIGQRAVTALYQKLPQESDTNIARRLGCNRHTLYEWQHGGASPSPIFLAAMCDMGLDVEWILTGRRKEK